MLVVFLTGTVAEFMIVRTAERLRRQRVCSSSAEAIIPASSTVRVTEPLDLKSCAEHRVLHHLLGEPPNIDELKVKWVTSMVCKGVSMTKSTWVLIRNARDTTYIAQVCALLYVEHERSKSIQRHFIVVNACPATTVITRDSRGTVGNLVVPDEAWKANVSSRIFSCVGLELSEILPCTSPHGVHGVRMFVMSP